LGQCRPVLRIEGRIGQTAARLLIAEIFGENGDDQEDSADQGLSPEGSNTVTTLVTDKEGRRLSFRP